MSKRKQEIQLTKDDVEKGLDIDQEGYQAQEQMENQKQLADEEILKQRKKFKIKRQLQQEQSENKEPRKNPFAGVQLVPEKQDISQPTQDIKHNKIEQKDLESQQKDDKSTLGDAINTIPSTETIIQGNINEAEQRNKRSLEEDTANTKQESNKKAHLDSKDENKLDQPAQDIDNTKTNLDTVKEDLKETESKILQNEKSTTEASLKEAPQVKETKDVGNEQSINAQDPNTQSASTNQQLNTGFSSFSTFGQSRDSFGQGLQGDNSKSLFPNTFTTPLKEQGSSQPNSNQNSFKLNFGASNSLFNLNQNQDNIDNENGSTNNNGNTPGAFSLFSNIKTPNSTLTETKPQQLKVQFDENFKQITGEEDEEIIFKGDGTLYTYTDTQQWKTKGSGDVRVTKDKNGKCRIIVRQKGVYRLLLNAKLWPDMTIQYQQNNTAITFSCINFATQQPQQSQELATKDQEENKGDDKVQKQEKEDKQKLETFALRIKNHEELEYLVHCVETNKSNGFK